ncbi:EamA family transporter [Komagataeibacter nataicola]|uniref:EamA family transporter n=1 Tax=Komagataeibacter nataicola TaxID=265960 RepID=A0A9N7CG64_9PROT|nr:DMT family transporter [Komagataeibacter nataicola]AQU88824.1 EamA family transporter [Komagataeibacter nataicola]PYD65574.1 EamA family transporter [Komagataeibacter nataicola]WEQ56718.1 DMT family transporter [Komagataeibacter nataicola]WNM08190.1 DMT family transporter [Komagataeibacter nataicola]
MASINLPSRQELALMAVTLFWGGTFLIVHVALRHCGPLFFVGLRFMTAGLAGSAIFHRALRRTSLAEAGAGMAVGITIWAGYTLQSYGLQTISSSRSAFLTALYVPIVPLLQWIVLHRPPRLMNWVGIGLAFCGLVLLAGTGATQGRFGRGEWATMLCAVSVAAEIVLISRCATLGDSRRITVVQLLVAGLLALLAMPVAGEHLPAFSWIWVAGSMGLGMGSMLVQLVMNWAQKAISPTRATIIYAGEPVWGGVVGRMAGDPLPVTSVVGACCIVAGVLASEIRLPARLKPRK